MFSFQCSSGPEEGLFCYPKYWPQINQPLVVSIASLALSFVVLISRSSAKKVVKVNLTTL